jgi:hypothetical protein
VQKGRIVERTDKELLVLAAKAAGIEISEDYNEELTFGLRTVDGWEWHPLIDSADAFRLAVKLNLVTGAFDNLGYASASCTTHGGQELYVEEPLSDDPCAAARRAIVRVAAKLGSTMPDVLQPSQSTE